MQPFTDQNVIVLIVKKYINSCSPTWGSVGQNLGSNKYLINIWFTKTIISLDEQNYWDYIDWITCVHIHNNNRCLKCLEVFESWRPAEHLPWTTLLSIVAHKLLVKQHLAP